MQNGTRDIATFRCIFSASWLRASDAHIYAPVYYAIVGSDNTVYRLFGGKPLFEPMLAYCELIGPWEISIQF